jgi:transcriptional regulator with PAS, ATPase and Fis domain
MRCPGGRKKRLVTINCAAFPETLLEAELFGYEKGAFTGADRAKQGRMELADGGTLFLDEIGEMPLSMQVKLLRVLEDRKIQRLGSVKEITLDVRLIAATNRELEKLIGQGKFREDLYYRLNVVRIELPPLAERQGDVLLLARVFLEKFSRKLGKEVTGISPAVASALTSYAWPGNVRELENIIERSVVLTAGSVISEADLCGLPVSEPSLVESSKTQTLADMEREHILRSLEQNDWNIGFTSEQLGIHRNTLHNKIKEYQLRRD